MTAPMKPWEMAGVNTRSMISTPGTENVTDPNGLQSSTPIPVTQTLPSGTPLNVRRVRTVPAPPPRPQRTIMRQTYIPNNSSYYSPYSSYGSYGNGYSGYSGVGTYGSTYGGYGSYGGYGMNRLGTPNLSGNDPESRFIQMAEENSRPAFQSIESLVHAFGSVSFMLESTFNAVYSSFRAVLSVAENFGRLRTLFGQFFSTFAVLRTLQWLYRKLLYLIGLRQENPVREAIWQQAAAGVAAPVDSKDARASWPILMFMGIMLSGPYLVWKLVNSLSSSQSANPYNPKEWKQSKDVSCSAIAMYDFVAASEQELSFNAGQSLMLAPQELQPRGIRGWLLATVDGNKVGLVPYNYIKIFAPTSQTGAHNAPVPVQTARIHSHKAPIANAQMGPVVAQYSQHIPPLVQEQSQPNVHIPSQTEWIPQGEKF